MASLVVVIELVADRPHPGSLEALGQARRIGSGLGATVYALAPCARAPGYGDDDLIAVLSRHGADKVLLATDGSYGGPMRWGSHGPLVQATCAQLRPSLLLAAATPGARDLAPRVAAAMGAALLADGWLDLLTVGEGELLLFDGSGDGARQLDGELEFPVVALVPPGRYATAAGDDEAEVEMVEAKQAAPSDFEDLGPEDAATAPPKVLGDGAAADELAAALGAARDGGGRVALALAVAPRLDALDGALAEVTVAIGEGAGECIHARYALPGEAAAQARALAEAVRKATAPQPAPAAEKAP
jgi:electron transfer flavoprotein alpha subunit